MRSVHALSLHTRIARVFVTVPHCVAVFPPSLCVNSTTAAAMRDYTPQNIAGNTYVK